jgi:hypothetical protein
MVTGTGFNGAAFELNVDGLDPATSYLLKRSETLQDDFPTTIGAPVMPSSSTHTFTDPSPTGGWGFYRVEEATP